MYSLRLWCSAEDSERILADLWEAGTVGVRELESDDGVRMVAGFETNENRGSMLARFAQCSPEWDLEEDTDWVEHTKAVWPGREVGERFFLAPTWCEQATPHGRLRLIHNPGLACGTGEHPCTQLALMALEDRVRVGDRVADIGAGSGILAIAALLLGAGFAIGVDPDEEALKAAKENLDLNGLNAALVVGSADALADGGFDVTVANMSGTVLLWIFEDLLRITKKGGSIIITGFDEWEVPTLMQYAPKAIVSEIDNWRCLTFRLED